MKVWSPLLATVLVLAGVSAQYDDDFSFEFFDDDSDADYGFTEVTDGPLPCNGFPQYRHLPINQAFYLGAHNAGSHVFEKSSQKQDIPELLEDGIRYLDINLCKDDEKVVVCSSYDSTVSGLTFADVMESILKFSRENVEQFLVLHLKSENVKQPVDTKELEELIDERCKIHTELTPGTNEYVKTECPFVQVFKQGKSRWPSMGEVVNYDPEMSQWVGDGEVVGVRTKFHISIDDSITKARGYTASYFSPAFWRSAQKGSKVESFDELKKIVNKQCRIPAGGIGLEAYLHADNEFIVTPNVLEDLFTSRSGCNLNDSPLNTFFSFVSVDNYQDQLAYWKELEGRMMDLNYQKWSGNYMPIAPSSLFKDEIRVTRDEL
ncbi:hypothetical protein EDC94DRAFT_656767 [Helicostylum pulchrum]|nr:hypothetical protein EDC94DRAFT_656767 [Helicostylum pulchrum]